MITYQEEEYAEVIDELKPLLVDHYHEVAMYQDEIELNPNYVEYGALAGLGMLHILTARDEGKVVGYVVSILNHNLHYMDHLFCVNDVLYVDPEYRHTEVAPNMLSELEAIMREKGVSVMTYHMKVFKSFETLMDLLGFDHAEHLYMKYIKED